MIIDRLFQFIEERSFVCVGLDTKIEYIPENFQTKDLSETIFQFNKEIIDATKDLVACFKVQIAFYESLGLQGMKAYSKTLKYLREQDLLSIGDVKRGDIEQTSEAYAKAHFTGDFEADFITVNPLMGFDTLEHYLPYLENKEKGIFVLVRTSNPGAKDIEYVDHQGEPLYYYIADRLKEMAEPYIGENKLSSLGFVVGGTHSEEAREIRNRYPDIPFLIPGYGAQGAKASDIKTYLGNGKQGIVNASRSILLEFQKHENGKENIGKFSRLAVKNMIKDIKEA